MSWETKKQRDENAPAIGHFQIISRANNELVVKIYGDPSNCLDHIGENDPALFLDWKDSLMAAPVELENQHEL